MGNSTSMSKAVRLMALRTLQYGQLDFDVKSGSRCAYESALGNFIGSIVQFPSTNNPQKYFFCNAHVLGKGFRSYLELGKLTIVVIEPCDPANLSQVANASAKHLNIQEFAHGDISQVRKKNVVEGHRKFESVCLGRLWS